MHSWMSSTCAPAVVEESRHLVNFHSQLASAVSGNTRGQGLRRWVGRTLRAELRAGSGGDPIHHFV